MSHLTDSPAQNQTLPPGLWEGVWVGHTSQPCVCRRGRTQASGSGGAWPALWFLPGHMKPSAGCGSGCKQEYCTLPPMVLHWVWVMAFSDALTADLQLPPLPHISSPPTAGWGWCCPVAAGTPGKPAPHADCDRGSTGLLIPKLTWGLESLTLKAWHHVGVQRGPQERDRRPCRLCTLHNHPSCWLLLVFFAKMSCCKRFLKFPCPTSESPHEEGVHHQHVLCRVRPHICGRGCPWLPCSTVSSLGHCQAPWDSWAWQTQGLWSSDGPRVCQGSWGWDRAVRVGWWRWFSDVWLAAQCAWQGVCTPC